VPVRIGGAANDADSNLCQFVSRERLTLDAIQWPQWSGTTIVLFVISYANGEECPTANAAAQAARRPLGSPPPADRSAVRCPPTARQSATRRSAYWPIRLSIASSVPAKQSSETMAACGTGPVAR
jgi:hypothetical protein